MRDAQTQRALWEHADPAAKSRLQAVSIGEFVRGRMEGFQQLARCYTCIGASTDIRPRLKIAFPADIVRIGFS